MTRADIFEAIKQARGDRGYSEGEVRALDSLLDTFGVPRDDAPPAPSIRKVSPAGIALMKQFEGCKLDAYPDPGSGDGNPWTVGYGATGSGISKGVRWTQEQADARFEQDVARFATGVSRLLDGSPATQPQFSALVSLGYNIGLSALGNSTLLRKHKAGDYEGAAAEFGRWVNNNGRRMAGLVRRRAAEAALYQGGIA